MLMLPLGGERLGKSMVMQNNGPTVHNLASGSSANALLIRQNGVSLLIDCGLPIRKLQASLKSLDMKIDDIDLLFVTHEHSDHVRSLPQLKRAGVTIVTSAGTARAMRMGPAEFVAARAGQTYDMAGFTIAPCAVSHDACEPLGLMVETGGLTISVMTDLGQISPGHIEVMTAADLIILESNHDIDMLRLGPYPPHLKRRVLSGTGHLSNVDAGKALRSVLARSNRDPVIWLAHLSETNNRPATAATTVRQHIPGARVRTLPRHDIINLMALHLPDPVASATPLQVPLWLEG
ncbi:MAG: MBL fold metallo-hydrolase [Thermomicrobiales bacterium]|nr:MBL fold metallo-hydrolase [Thermomicrobiales bacterium]